MAEQSTPLRPMTVEEFLEMEQASSVRHEYVDGEIFAFAGATDTHNQIVLNIAAPLWQESRRGTCRVYANAMLVRVNERTLYYPDVVVTCADGDDDRLVKRMPCMVVEVLSPGTSITDRREKLANYRAMDSLQAYIIIHQDRVRVDRHFRGEDGLWWHAILIAGAELPIPCPEMTIQVNDIYERVILPAPLR
jgi:Uma2 family endonuclease